MTIIAIVPALIALLGVVLWFVPANAKVQELGKWMFICGLVAVCLVLAGHVVRIG